MEEVYSEIKGNIKIVVKVDDHPSDPREWDNLGKMVCFHRRYNLGDKHEYRHEDYNGWEEMKEAIVKEEDAVVILPLFLYDHSGITMSVGDFGDRWDSGQVGWIYASRKDVREWYNVKRVTKHIVERVESALRSEVETYDAYITGEVYSYSVYEIQVCDKDHEHLHFKDGCGGYYDLNECIEEAKSYL